MDNSQNTKRIAKNTLMLYVRMFVTMLISLYTSRVILASLGVEDYGIYNVVGGIVGMFGVITSAMNIAISRFITFELGKGDEDRLKRVFSTAITIQLIISLIIVILSETVGLWYLNNVMVIPADRMTAARWCYQFSIITCVIGLVAVPYNSAVIAHEKMSVFAFMGILGAGITLLVAFLIGHNPFDRLVFYGLLLMLVSLLTQQIYMWYCLRHFKETRFRIIIDKEMLKPMFGFAGWTFLGTSAYILRVQGSNLLLNYYFNPIVNAARGVANSVNNAVASFSGNFATALNPQITKSYASEDYHYLNNLIFRGARLTVYLLLFVSAPLLLNTQFVLGVWLKEVPEHAVFFTQLVLISSIVEMVSGSLITSIVATGKVKYYYITIGIVETMNVPVSWILLHLGCIPETVMIVDIAIAHLSFAAKLYFAKQLVNIDTLAFMKKVYLNILTVTVIGFVLPIMSRYSIPEGWLNFFVTSTVCVLSMGCSMLFVGCSRNERQFIFEFVKRKLKRQ